MRKKIILSLMGFFILSIILTGCSDAKKVMSGEDFTNGLKNLGYIINDESDEYKDMTTSYISANDVDEEKFFLFIDFKAEDNAFDYYESMHSQLHSIEHNAKNPNNIEKKGSNFQYQELTTDDYFYRIIKVDKTVLYVQTSVYQKSEVMDIVKELGY